MMHSLSRALRVKCSTQVARNFLWRKGPLVTGMPVPGCSRPHVPGQMLSHVVAICGVGISPNSAICSQKSFFDVV